MTHKLVYLKGYLKAAGVRALGYQDNLEHNPDRTVDYTDA
ncbi:2672_t:CDS:2 [Funneliformis caledonium]|uniref:2672_t:CDS:1 n=1 Tax=Funneliformis caledonium TaxID=1117310 RepID=A0A9N9BBH2_9GLOM|nr:2672_t:CDS:2 [Funneliformis caledonium]